MKNLFTNIAVFVVLSVVLSSFAACSDSASSQNGSVDNSTVSNTISTASNTNSATAKGSDFPPVPSGLMQAEIRDLDGNTFNLGDKKGKVVLVNLWATWCGPCRAEMPDLVALQDKYKDKDFEIIGLDSDDESPESVKAFAQNMKLNYQLGYADDKFFNEFLKITRMQGIPQSILINREGKMTGVFLGGGASNIGKMKDSVEKAVSE